MDQTKEFDASRFPRRLNLGCGWDHRDGYLNVDLNAFHNPDLVSDVRKLPMLPSGHYVEIIAQDVLEHLPRTSTASTLLEWNRLLAIDGRLHLRVPSLEGLARLFEKYKTFEKHRELMQCLFGTQGYTGDCHQTSFTAVLLEGYLTRSGFHVDQLAMRDEWLFDVDARKTSHVAPLLEERKAALLELGEDEEFLAQAYQVMLRRQPDSEGRSFYAKALAASQLTREQVLAIIEGSPEFRTVHGDSDDI